MTRALALAAGAATVLAAAPPASAATFGASMRVAPNAGFGCERAVIRHPITGGPTLAPTNQTSCTYRSLGFVARPGGLSLAPSNGRITRIRVRSPGPRPALLRLTILTSSGSCCTARYVGPAFRPRPNGLVTSRPVNVRVFRTVHSNGTQSNDVIGLTAVGPGRLPLRINRDAGAFRVGAPIVTFWHPRTLIGQPRADSGYTMDGIQLIFNWDFRPA